MKKMIIFCWLSSMLILAAGCFPVELMLGMTPRQGMEYCAKEKVPKDVDDCLRKASEAGLEIKKGTGHTSTFESRCKVWGSDDMVRDILREYDLDPDQRKFVEDCLRVKGYFKQPTFW